MVRKCWLHKDRECNENCAAFLRLDTINPIHGVPLVTGEHGEIRTYCAVISALWEIGEGLKGKRRV